MQSSNKSLYEAGESLEKLLRALNAINDDDEPHHAHKNFAHNGNFRRTREPKNDDMNSWKLDDKISNSSLIENQVSNAGAMNSRGFHNVNDRSLNNPRSSQSYSGNSLNNRSSKREESGTGLKRAGSIISTSSSTPNLVTPTDVTGVSKPGAALNDSRVCQRSSEFEKEPPQVSTKVPGSTSSKPVAPANDSRASQRCAELEKELRQVSSKLQDSQQQNQELLRQLDESSKIRQGFEKREEALRQVIQTLGVSESELKEMLAEGQSSRRKRTSSQSMNDFKAKHAEPNQSKLAEENRSLTKDLHDKNLELQRLESHQEKIVNDYGIFLQSIANSSSKPVLDESIDLKTSEILGMGNYGFVILCNSAKQNQRLVVKLQSQRWVDVAVHEWAHGSELGAHPHIVAYVAATMHRDTKREVCHLLQKGFEDGCLTGKKPKFFPDVYFCMALEYCNRGTVQNFMDKGLLSMEGTAAITRQVASALAFIHHKKQTHNDIKPENVLLADVPGRDHLVVKLADLGLADYSIARKRDCDLYAYTVWCLGLGRKFGKCPEVEGREAAVEQLQHRVGRTWSVLATVVSGLWQDKMEPAEIKDHPKLQDCEVRAEQSKSLHEELESAAKNDAHRRMQQLATSEKFVMKFRKKLSRKHNSQEAEDASHRL